MPRGEEGEEGKQNLWILVCHDSCKLQSNFTFSPCFEAVLHSGVVAVVLTFFRGFSFWPLQEAIRVILGNLHDLHPFSTDHFTIFPCILSSLFVKEKVPWLVSVGHCFL